MAKLTLCVSMMLVLLAALGESSPLCCTRYHESPIPVKRLKYYVIQEDTGYCNIKAVIFKTIKNKPVCADPDAMWVRRAKEVVPQKVRA
ncbi:C-C motif chemokine 20 [Pagrus major]|uniref:C-C motif chemokine 20 n=1 Tax=Pagrus major TaxID=143350 RepID=UPI003CC8C027